MAPVAIQAEIVSANKQGAPESKDRAYQQFQQTYGPPTLENTQKSQQPPPPPPIQEATSAVEDDCLEIFDVDSASFWDVLTFFSMIFLWFQRSTIGVVSVMRSLVLGHCFQLLFRATLANSNDYATSAGTVDDHHHHHNPDNLGVRKYFYMMQSLLLGSAGAHMNMNVGINTHSSSPHKQVNGAWPPQPLVGLAVLTVLCLVVHPDGMTWIVLRKIRDTFMVVLQSSTTCWAIMIRDYGVLGTVSASASITLVLVLALAMHKAFLSNCCGTSDQNAAATKRRNTLPDKKRRRRKGHRGRIKGTSSNPSSSPLCPRLPKVEEVSSDGASNCGSRRNSASGDMLKGVFEPPVKRPIAQDTVDPNMCVDTKRTMDQHEEEGASIMTSPSALESVVSEDFEAKGRTPVPSVCTVDTTSMSDDISCGSFSVRSAQLQQQQQQPVRQTNSRANKSKSNATRGGKANSKANRGQKQQQQQKATDKMNPMTTTTKARADGLKPTKPATYANEAPTSMRFDQFKKTNANANGQKRNSGGGKGRVVANQNGRTGRGKGGRVAKNQKNQPTAQNTSPPTTRASSISINTNSKTAGSPPSVLRTPTVLIGSPITEVKKGTGNTDNRNDGRLPPFSPYSQSLFSCEIGASEWSLPALPVVDQPAKTTSLTPALNYQTNPFVTPYSQMTQYSSSGRTTPVVLPEPGTSLGLWNSVQPDTPSTVASSSDLNLTTAWTTPQRKPLRAPPGLPTPPGFSEACLSQPVSSNVSDLYTPVRTPEKPSVAPTTPPTFGTRSTDCSASPLTWSTMGLGDKPLSATATTTTRNHLNEIRRSLVKENPFAEHPDEAECRIEEELQELGGRMIGSILDF